MADDLWEQVKLKFDNMVEMGFYAAHEWADVVTLHRSPSEAMKAIEKRAAELNKRKSSG